MELLSPHTARRRRETLSSWNFSRGVREINNTAKLMKVSPREKVIFRGPAMASSRINENVGELKNLKLRKSVFSWFRYVQDVSRR